MAHEYEIIRIRPPLSYHQHLSIFLPKPQGPKSWKSLSSVLLIGLTTGSGTKTWRLWTNLPTVPVLHPVISISSDSV